MKNLILSSILSLFIAIQATGNDIYLNPHVIQVDGESCNGYWKKAVVQGDSIYAGGEKGLIKIAVSDENKISEEVINATKIFQIACDQPTFDSHGNMFVGTKDGIYISKDYKTFTYITGTPPNAKSPVFDSNGNGYFLVVDKNHNAELYFSAANHLSDPSTPLSERCSLDTYSENMPWYSKGAGVDPDDLSIGKAGNREYLTYGVGSAINYADITNATNAKIIVLSDQILSYSDYHSTYTNKWIQSASFHDNQMYIGSAAGIFASGPLSQGGGLSFHHVMLNEGEDNYSNNTGYYVDSPTFVGDHLLIGGYYGIFQADIDKDNQVPTRPNVIKNVQKLDGDNFYHKGYFMHSPVVTEIDSFTKGVGSLNGIYTLSALSSNNGLFAGISTNQYITRK